MNRDKTIAARVSPAERRAFEELALFEQMRPSEALRLLIREGARQRGLWRPNGQGKLSPLQTEEPA